VQTHVKKRQTWIKNEFETEIAKDDICFSFFSDSNSMAVGYGQLTCISEGDAMYGMLFTLYTVCPP
jgi:hypothetical protein